MSTDSSFASTLKKFLCRDTVEHSSDRIWGEKKYFDFLTSETSASAIAMAKSTRVERVLQELSVPASYDQKASSDCEAVQLAVNEDNFKSFGSDIFQTFYDVATSAKEPLRRFALLRLEVTTQMWLQNYPSLSNTNNESTPAEILAFIMGIYTLERVGIGHDAKEEVRAAAERCSVEDFFGVTAAAFTPSTRNEPPLSFCEYSNALTYSFFAGKIGIDIKVDLPTVLTLLPLYRPYKQFTNLQKEDTDEFTAYLDQLTMLFNLIHVLSNYGELRLSHALLPQEYAYLSDPVHVARATQEGGADVHLLGELCHCLAVLGHTEQVEEKSLKVQREEKQLSGLSTPPSVGCGLKYLRDTQSLADGSWPARDNRDDAYARCHATMCAVSALNPMKFRGFGPSDPLLLDRLCSDKEKKRTQMKYLDDSGVNRCPSSDLDMPLHLRSHELNDIVTPFMGLNQLYKLSADAVSQEIGMSAQVYGSLRLKNILKSQETMKSYQGPLLLSQQRLKNKKKRSRDSADKEWKNY